MLILNLFIAITFVLIIIAAIIFSIARLGSLRSRGKQITALVTSVQHAKGTAIWGPSQDHYFVTAVWADLHSGKKYTFEAWSVDIHAVPIKGSLVFVLIDPRNPRNYLFHL